MRKFVGILLVAALAVWAGSGLGWLLDHPEFRETIVFKSGVLAVFFAGVLVVFQGVKK